MGAGKMVVMGAIASTRKLPGGTTKRKTMFSDVILPSFSTDEHIHEQQTTPGIISLCSTQCAVQVNAINSVSYKTMNEIFYRLEKC